ncbi:MAG: hypothetical protein M3463_19650 [Verrucomicrobiota bacterium]|nr:hypothetical protein [Verrucomicrobiota bacterium]
MQRGKNRDFDQQFRNVILRLYEYLPQARWNIRAIRQDRLLHEVVEQLFDKSVLRLRAVRGERRQVARAAEADRFPLVGEVIADRADRPAIFLGAKAADRVVLFE